MIDDSLKVPIEIEGPDYLIQCLYGAGCIYPGVSGPQPLPWAEIEAWNRSTRSGLTAWELETMRELSQCYASTLNAARDKNCLPPHLPIEYKVTGDQIKSAMRIVGKRKR